MEEKAKLVAELLKMLANENRLMILCALIESELTVTDIQKKVENITQSAVSQHLGLLKAYGIIDSKKNGQNISYSITDTRVIKVIDVLREYYCN